MSQDIYRTKIFILTPNTSFFSESGARHLTHALFNDPRGLSGDLSLITFYSFVENDLYLDITKQITLTQNITGKLVPFQAK